MSSQKETTNAREQVLDQVPAYQSESARAVDESGVVCRTHVGGQALIEGIMMRGKYNWALAVRKSDGMIHLEEHDLASGKDKNSWMYKPVVRGCTALVESLALGYKALGIAAKHAFEGLDEEEEGRSEVFQSSLPGSGTFEANVDESSVSEPSIPESSVSEPSIPESSVSEPSIPESSDSVLPKSVLTVSMIIGILLGIGIFIVLPAVVTNLIVGGYGERTLIWNVVDGILRVAIFIFYIWLIGRMSDIKRMFAYHGAEHKTIHCYEHGLGLTVFNARRFPSLHVRCGTAFMLTTMVVAIFVFTIVPVQLLIAALGIENEILRLALVIFSRVILLPIVAGLSYEVTVKWAGTRPNNPLVRIILWPGLQMQRLTTNEPDDEMIECAIQAMLRVLRREEKEAAEQKRSTVLPSKAEAV